MSDHSDIDLILDRTSITDVPAIVFHCDQPDFFSTYLGLRANQLQTRLLRATHPQSMTLTNMDLCDVSHQVPCHPLSQRTSSSGLPIKVKSLAGLVDMDSSPSHWNSNAPDLTLSVSSSSSDECELQDLSNFETNVGHPKVELCPTIGFDSLRNIRDVLQRNHHKALDNKTRNSQITLVENKRFLSNGHHPLRQTTYPRIARSKTSDVVTLQTMKHQTLFIQLKDRSPDTTSVDESASRSPGVSSSHKPTTTESSSRSRTVSSGQSQPQNHISRDVAIELMSQFLDEFGHLYTDSEACTLLKRCGDWTLLFEVSTLKSQELSGMECFEGEDLKDQQKYLEEVMAMVWDEEEDNVLRIPEKELTSQDRIQARVIEKRKGHQAIANRKVFLSVLKKK